MGLNLTVYRTPVFGDCTLRGISSNHDEVVVVNVEGPSKPSDDRPAVMLVDGALRGTVRIVPAVENPDGSWSPEPRWTMFGGNYAATSDSRWSEAIEARLGARFYGAVAIHDRIETVEQMARHYD